MDDENASLYGADPPPNNIPKLPEEDAQGNPLTEGTIRRRMKAHRRMGASCNSCHQIMDPMGLGFENFNSIGQFRTIYNDSLPVDASGELPGNRRFQTVRELADILAEDPQVAQCLSEKLLSYSIGRDVHKKVDRCQLQSLTVNSEGTYRSLSETIQQVVKSSFFRKTK